MKDLQVFNFNNAEVRTLELNGKIVFVAKDVCDVLELKNISTTLERVDEDDLGEAYIIDSIGRKQLTSVINESGLYSIIFQSNKPEAKLFKKWVTSEVLPSIRKTGSYSTSNNSIDILSTAQKAIHVYKDIAELFGLKGNPALISANVATRKDTGIDFQARLGITLIAEDNERILTPTEIGQQIGKTAREVNRILIENLYQTKIGKMYHPTTIGEPYAVIIDSGKKNSSGAMVQQLKWKDSIIKILK